MGVESRLAAARSALAARQQELVTALVADGPVPEGFEPHRVSAVRLGRARKRLGGLGSTFRRWRPPYGLILRSGTCISAGT